jgi:DNA-binding winged helix-turn-helix (wHTH) protein/tetratricopeptide (TPR) repeat protein
VSDLLPLLFGSVDLLRRRVSTPTGEARLTTTEVALLRYLAARPARTVPRDELLREVWGYAEGAASRTIDVTVRRLRAKIEADPAAPTHLLAVHGVGYTFVPAVVEMAAAAAVAPTAAPITPDALIGRVDERAAAWAHLDAGARPLTVTGPAGVGKTRFAQALVEDARAGGRAACFVDLVAAASAEDLALATAAALGLAAATDRAIAGALGGALVVLDNFEQLPVDAAARVAAWIGAAPGAALVVTSRRRLALPDEALLRLEPLPVDDAVALFCRRALRVRPDVRLDDVAGLRALVRRVDGLPLALELSASRTRALSVAEVAARLDVPFLRDVTPATPRRATLGLALDASWALLDADARRALVALAAVPGATFVAVAEGLLIRVGISDPLGALEVLVDHSLVRVVEGPPGSNAARLAPFVVVMEYAAARSAEVAISGATAAWIGALADTLGVWAAHDTAPDRPPGVLCLLAETDAVLALLQRHADAARSDALRAAEAWLVGAGRARGHPAEATIGDLAVGIARAVRDARQLARLLALRVWVYDRAGRVDAACADADEVSALAAVDPELARTRASAQLGCASALRRAMRHAEALAVLDAFVVPREGALAFLNGVQSERGLILLRMGDVAGASAAFEEALDTAEAGGDPRGAGFALDNLALTRIEAGRGAEIEARVRAAVATRRAVGGDATVPPLWYALGAIALEAGRLGEARAGFLAERDAAVARGMVSAIWSAAMNLAYVDLRAGDLPAAVAAFRDACAGFAAIGRGRTPTPATVGLAITRAVAGEAGVTLEPAPAAGTPIDDALHALAAAVLAFAAVPDPENRARLDAALDTPIVATSLDVREFVRFVRGWVVGR